MLRIKVREATPRQTPPGRPQDCLQIYFSFPNEEKLASDVCSRRIRTIYLSRSDCFRRLVSYQRVSFSTNRSPM